MKTKMNVLELLFLILTALCVVYAVIIYRVGSGTLSFVIWIAGAVFFGLAAFLAGNGRWMKLPVVLRKVSYCLIVLLALVFLCCFAAMISHFGDKGDKKLDYIVVLGAQMRHQKPSTIFKYRLDAAYTYLAGHPDTICIVSGGKGSNEPVSEGDGGKEYLISKGIPPERILAETKALNTRENISNSLALMDRPKGSTQKLRIGIVTNNYHVFRGVHLAKSLTKDKVFGIAAHTVPLYLPNNMVRECFGIIRDLPMLYTFPGTQAYADTLTATEGDFLYTAGRWYYKGKGGDVRLPEDMEEIDSSLFSGFRGDIDTLYIPGNIKQILTLTGPRSIKTIYFENGKADLGSCAAMLQPTNGIHAPKHSNAWNYASSKGYFVTDKTAPLFERKTLYLLKGDFLNTVFFNRNVMLYTKTPVWSVSDPEILKKQKIRRPGGGDTGKSDYKAMKTGTVTVTAALDNNRKLSYRVVVLKKTESNRLLCFKNLCKGMSKKEKAAYLVKWIHQNVIYDHAAAYPYTVSDSVLSSYGYKSRNDSKMWEASTSYGALVKRQAICGGISSAYFLAAKTVGLKCITITGTLNSKPHAWNMVCVGSYWYYVDATNIATLRVSLGRNYGFDRKTIEKEYPLLPFTE